MSDGDFMVLVMLVTFIALVLILVLAVFRLRKAGVRGPRLALEVVLILAGGAALWVAGEFALHAVGFWGRRPPPDETVILLLATVAGVAWLRVRRQQKGPAPVRATPPAAPLATPVPATPTAAPRHRGVVFVSYRRADSSDVTGRIYDRLEARFGRDGVFKDVDSIALGVDFREELAASMVECRVLITVIGPRWTSGADAARPHPLQDAGDYVRVEIEAALKRGIPVIPVLVQGARIPSPDELPPSLHPLAYRNGIAVRPDPDFQTDMARLIRGIETHLQPERLSGVTR